MLALGICSVINPFCLVRDLLFWLEGVEWLPCAYVAGRAAAAVGLAKNGKDSL